ncbi:MAG: hypothetical protein NVSMB31_12320 [Vulcanimicrobiaceae bacterium]
MYTAQQTRIVDGCNLPLIAFTAWHMYEVSKFLSLTSHSWSGVMLIANGEAWNQLAPDIQAQLDRANTKYARLERSDAKKLAQSLAARLSRLGITINSTDQAPFKKMLGSYYQYWAGVFGPTAWKALETSLRRTL